MRTFTSLVCILPVLSGIISAVPLVPRARDKFAAVVSDIGAISSDITDLTGKVNSFDGDLLQSLAIIVADLKLDTQIKETTETVKSSAAFNSTESDQLALTLAGLVSPITTSLTAIQNKVRSLQQNSRDYA